VGYVVGPGMHDLERVVQIQVGASVPGRAEKLVPLAQRLGLLPVRREQRAETPKIPLREFVRGDPFAGGKMFPIRGVAGTDALLHAVPSVLESFVDRSAGLDKLVEGRHTHPIGTSA
jgi:hypothetical protein